MKNKGLKKFLTVFLSTTMCLSLYATPISAETTEEAEQIENEEMVEGDDIVPWQTDGNMKWRIDANGTLYVEGSGDYVTSNTSEPGWLMDTNAYNIKAAKVKVTGITNTSKMFWYCKNLTSVDLTGSDFSDVTDMSHMFENCPNLKEVKWSSNLDTSKVTAMRRMYYGDSALEKLDLSNFNTAKVIDMCSMFEGCSNLRELNLTGKVNTSNVIYFCAMFKDCNNLTGLDLRNFRTGNATDMGSMFANCKNLKSLDVSTFETSNVVDMAFMFGGCDNLTTINWNVDKFDTGNAKTMFAMFNGDKKLTELNLSKFNTSKVVNMQSMFSTCTSLKKLDLRSFNMDAVKNIEYMLANCNQLSELTMPANLKCKIDFPGGTWRDQNGVVCKNPTQGLSTPMTYSTKDFNNNSTNPTPNNNGGGNASVKEGTEFASYQGDHFYRDGNGKVRCYDTNGNLVKNNFKCDGTYTYYFQNDGTAMANRLTYHPDGVHIIYFDGNGHEVFNNFTHIKKNIEGEPVDDLCFFDVYGHMYVDFITYDQTGTYLYYANPYGVMERNGWVGFSDEQGGGIGYAISDGTLVTNQFSYDTQGRLVYFQGDGKLARGLISDGTSYYQMDEMDGHCVAQFPVQ